MSVVRDIAAWTIIAAAVIFAVVFWLRAGVTDLKRRDRRNGGH